MALIKVSGIITASSTSSKPYSWGQAFLNLCKTDLWAQIKA